MEVKQAIHPQILCIYRVWDKTLPTAIESWDNQPVPNLSTVALWTGMIPRKQWASMHSICASRGTCICQHANGVVRVCPVSMAGFQTGHSPLVVCGLRVGDPFLKQSSLHWFQCSYRKIPLYENSIPLVSMQGKICMKLPLELKWSILFKSNAQFWTETSWHLVLTMQGSSSGNIVTIKAAGRIA